MDVSGQNIAKFLEKMQHLRSSVYRDLHNLLIKEGARTAKIYDLILSGTLFRIHLPQKVMEYSGALVTGMHIVPSTNNKPEFELSITIIWDDEKFIIETEIEIEREEIELFQAFPVRIAETLDDCLREIDGAADDLRNYADTIVRELL